MRVAAALNRPLDRRHHSSTSPLYTPPLADQVGSSRTDIRMPPCFKAHLQVRPPQECLIELMPEQVIGLASDWSGASRRIG